MAVNLPALQAAMSSGPDNGFDPTAAAKALSDDALAAFQSFGTEALVTGYYTGMPALGVVAAQNQYSAWLLSGYSVADARAKALAFFAGVAAGAAPLPCVLPDGWGLSPREANVRAAVLTVPRTVTKAVADAWLAQNAPGNVCGGTTIEGTVYWDSPELAAYLGTDFFPIGTRHILPPPLGTSASTTATVLTPAVPADTATAPRPILPTSSTPAPVGPGATGASSGPLLSPSTAVTVTDQATTPKPATPAPAPLDMAKAKTAVYVAGALLLVIALLALLARAKVK